MKKTITALFALIITLTVLSFAIDISAATYQTTTNGWRVGMYADLQSEDGYYDKGFIYVTADGQIKVPYETPGFPSGWTCSNIASANAILQAYNGMTITYANNNIIISDATLGTVTYSFLAGVDTSGDPDFNDLHYPMGLFWNDSNGSWAYIDETSFYYSILQENVVEGNPDVFVGGTADLATDFGAIGDAPYFVNGNYGVEFDTADLESSGVIYITGDDGNQFNLTFTGICPSFTENSNYDPETTYPSIYGGTLYDYLHFQAVEYYTYDTDNIGHNNGISITKNGSLNLDLEEGYVYILQVATSSTNILFDEQSFEDFYSSEPNKAALQGNMFFEETSTMNAFDFNASIAAVFDNEYAATTQASEHVFIVIKSDANYSATISSSFFHITLAYDEISGIPTYEGDYSVIKLSQNLDLTYMVGDLDSPVINAPTLYTYTSDPITLTEIMSNITVTDNQDPNPTLTVVDDNYTPNKKYSGEYYIRFRAMDASGNISYATINVIVYDDIAPIWYFTDEATDVDTSKIYDINIPWSATMTPRWSDLTNIPSSLHFEAKDLEGISEILVSDNENYFDNYNILGTYSVVLVAVDPSGNESDHLNIRINVVLPINYFYNISASKTTYFVSDLDVLNVEGLLDTVNYVDAYGDYWGISPDYYISEDTYTGNTNVLGYYHIVINAESYDENYNPNVPYCTDTLTITIVVVDVTAPEFHFSELFTAYTSTQLTSLELTALFINNGFYDENTQSISIVVDDYSANYNVVGTYDVTAIISDNDNIDNYCSVTLSIQVQDAPVDTSAQNWFMTKWIVVKDWFIDAYNWCADVCDTIGDFFTETIPGIYENIKAFFTKNDEEASSSSEAVSEGVSI